MKRWKNNLDEMQEQKLLKIEHTGVWIAFWGLFAVLSVQTILGAPLAQLAGEYVVFMALSIYLVVRCFQEGIWDRHLRPDAKTNFLISLIAGIVTGGIVATINVVQYGFDGSTTLVTAGITALFTIVVCFAALSIGSAAFKRRAERAEQACEAAEDGRSADTDGGQD